MVDLNVIKFDRNGHPETGLQAWETISEDLIVSGNPIQRGHQYFSTENDKLVAGVWDCTEHELVLGHYDVDEMMVVLEGSITIKDKTGQEETFRAGDSFIVPKGTECSWKQYEYTRKFYMIYDNADSQQIKTDDLAAIRVDANAELPRVSGHDAELYLSEVPDMGMLVLYADPDNKFISGVWDCSPMKRVATTIERSELMHILEGSGSITNADGVVFEFRAGDTFLVPVGMGYQWQNREYVKKIFCSYIP